MRTRAEGGSLCMRLAGIPPHKSRWCQGVPTAWEVDVMVPATAEVIRESDG